MRVDRFLKGYRIRLELVNGDSTLTDRRWTHPYHPSKMGSDTSHHNARYSSRLLLPLIKTLRRGK